MHEHDLVCGSCGNELRSVTQERCTHCGANDPLHAAANEGHKEVVGSPEFPRTIGGLTLEQVRQALAGEQHAPKQDPKKSEKRYSNVAPVASVVAPAHGASVREKRYSNV